MEIFLSNHFFTATYKSFFSAGAHSSFKVGHNFIPPYVFCGRSIYFYIYLIILISSGTSGFILYLINKKSGHSLPSISKIFVINITPFFIIIAFFQLNGILNYAKLHYNLLRNLKTDEKYEKFSIDNIFLFAETCKRILGPNRSAKFLTDMDLSKDPGQLMHRQLAYFLYPIDIRNVRGEAYDSIIIFNKKNARDYIPDGFKILWEKDSRYLLAIKQGKQS